MAKGTVSTSDLAARIMGAGIGKPSQPKRQVPASVGAEPGGLKRLNLDISIEQWRKLKRYATDRDETMSDVVRGFIDAL